MQPRRPTNDDPGAWIYYWRKVGQGWRREPEIGIERQLFLSGLIDNAEVAHIGKHSPFEGLILHRSDIEWIVAEYPGRRIDLRGTNHRWSDVLGIEPTSLAFLILGASHDATSNNLNNGDSKPNSKGTEGPPSEEFVQAIDNVQSDKIGGGEATSLAPLEADPKAQKLLAAYGTGERDFTGWDLAGAILKHSCLKDANLTKVNLEKADLSNADLGNAILVEANLTAANISFANLTSTNLFGAKLVGAKLCSTVMRNSNLMGADFDWANLANAQLQGSHWGGAHWGHAKWPGAVWNDPLDPRPSSYAPASPISSADYIGEWWSRDRDN